VPTGVKFFSWVATLYRGKITAPTPMLFVLGGIVVFLLGGLTGPPNATVSTDLHLHDTYFIVGHFHDTMFGGYIFPFFAALYYWFPKATGKKLNETLGKWHFWLMTPSFLILTLYMMRVGLLGMRRRIADYDPALGFDFSHLIMTIAGMIAASLSKANLSRSTPTAEKPASEPAPLVREEPKAAVKKPAPEPAALAKEEPKKAEKKPETAVKLKAVENPAPVKPAKRSDGAFPSHARKMEQFRKAHR